MESKKPLISIIVPVYNVEEYVARCIKSICKQTYSNIQVILVDDGSTDTSGEICDKFALQDSRIEVVHQKNQGLSEARNTGFAYIKGSYISFVDSDDYISENYISYLYGLIVNENADLSSCKYIETNKEFEFSSGGSSEYHTYNREEAFEKLCYQLVLTTSAWGKLYKVELFESIKFPKGKLYEDVGTFYKILENASVIVCGEQVHYLYYRRATGIVRSGFNPAKMDYFYQSWEFAEYIRDYHKELYDGAISRVVWSSLHLWVQIDSKRENPKEYNELKNTICKYRAKIIKDKKVRKKNKIVLLGSYCGHWFLKIVYRMTK